MLKIIDLTNSKLNNSELISIINKSIHSKNTTTEIKYEQFNLLNDLGFKMVFANTEPFIYLVKNNLITKSEIKDDYAFVKVNGNKETLILLSKRCFNSHLEENVKYMITGKVFYKNKTYYNKNKPTIIFHSKPLLTNCYKNVMIYHDDKEVDATYQSKNKNYKVKLESNKNIFLNLVEYESPRKIIDIEIIAYGKIFNLNNILKLFPRLKNINRNEIINFENHLTKSELKLLEIISI